MENSGTPSKKLNYSFKETGLSVSFSLSGILAKNLGLCERTDSKYLRIPVKVEGKMACLATNVIFVMW